MIPKYGLPDDTTGVYLLESEGRQGFVCSGQSYWAEAAVAYYEPTLFGGGRWPPEGYVGFGLVAKAD